MDLFDKWAKEDADNGFMTGVSVRPALDVAADTTADKQARDMELAESLGFTPEVIAEQREWAEGEEKARTIERNPLFARWAEEDKTNAAFARDDTEKMGDVFEILHGSESGVDMAENKWVGQLKKDIRKGLLQYNARRGDKAAQEQLMQEAGLTEDEIRHGAYRQTPQPGAIGQLTESFKEGTDQVGRGMLGAMALLGENLQKDVVTGNATPWAPAWEALARHARGRIEEIERTTSAPLNAEGWVNDVVRNLPQVLAGGLTAYATGGLGAGLFVGAQIAGNQYLDLTEKHDVVFQPARDMDELARLMVEKKHGWQTDDVVNDVNMAAARAELIAHAILNTEQSVPTGTAAVASLANAAVQAPLEAIGLGKLADVFRTTGLGNVVKRVVEQVSTEFVTEAIQQHPDEFSRIWAEGTARGESWNDIWGTYVSRFGEITREGLYSGLVAAPFGVLGGLGRVATDARLAREARDWVVAQRVFKQKVDETKAAQVAPIVMQRALESGGLTGEVNIPAAEVLRLHQEGVPVLERMGWDVEDVQVEVERGGEMTAKLARMHAFMDAGDFDSVMQFARPAVGAWNMAEAEQFDARVKEDVDKLVADAVSDNVERSAIDAETARIEAEMRQAMQSIPGLRTEIKGTGSLIDMDPKAQDTVESAVAYNMQVIRAMAARFSASGMPASDFLSRIHLQGMQMDERGRLLTPEEMRQHMQNVEESEAANLEAEALRPFWEKVWHRVDPASLKKDWPEAEREFRKLGLGGMFRNVKNGGMPIDQIADELGMDTDSLVEKLKTMQRPRRGYYQEGVTAEQKLAADVAAWEETVERVDSGQVKREERTLQVLAQTPLVFTLVGAKQLPVRTTKAKIEKALKTKHNISKSVIKQIAGKLADPIMIVRSTGEDSLSDITVMVDLKDENGSTVVVPIMFNDTKHGYEMNFAPSFYVKNNKDTKKPSNQWFADQLKLGNVLYANKEKVKGWNRIAGRYLPGWNSIPNKDTILFEDSLVKLKAQFPGYYQRAWHGTPHDFDAFTLQAIGSGEGAQAHGWGLYFAKNKTTAKRYKTGLSKGKGGRLFEVDIPENNVLLDEQKAFSAQHKNVQKLILEAIQAMSESEQDVFYKRILGSKLDDSEAYNKATAKLDRERLFLKAITGISDSKFVRIWHRKTLLERGYSEEQIDELWADTEKAKAEIQKFLPEVQKLEAEQKALKQKDDERRARLLADAKSNPEAAMAKVFGEELYDAIAWAVSKENHPDFRAASEALNSAGIKGITYEGGRDGRCFVVFDDKAIQILDKLYQEMNQSITRGFVEIAKGQEYTIQLLKDANLSTVLHETSHIMLAEMEHLIRSGMANDALARDYQTIRNWLELKDGDDLASLTDPRMVQANEKFAKGMELYLREGKAPSRNLETAFARFKRWLTRIYREIVNDPYFDGVTLNDDVREVFDRLLANENEIARASEKLGISDSMRAELDALGLSGNERARMTALIQEAQEEAADGLQKARDAHRTAQLAQWRKEADEVIKEEPEYKALQTMRKEGLNLDSVVQLGGEEMKNRLLKRMPGSVRKDGMLSPEIVAWESGFETAEEMVAAVAAYPAFKDRQRQIIEQKQKEHDASFDAEDYLFETEALAASEEELGKRIASILAKPRYRAELRGQTVGGEAVQPTEDQAQDAAAVPVEDMRDPETRVVNGELVTEYMRDRPSRNMAQYQASRARIRELAAESLRGSRVRDAMYPEKFRQTVRRMIREERRALLRQDWEAALVANYQLRLNMELARQSAQLRTNLEKFETKLKKFLKNEKNDPNARYAAAHLGVSVGFVPTTSMVNRTAQGRNFKNVEAWAKTVEEEGFPVILNLPLWVEGSDVLWRDMRLAEFEEWHNELKMIVNVETERRKVNTSRGKMELAQLGEEMAASIREHNPNSDTSKVEEKGKVRQALEAFHAEHMKADSIAMLADGDQMGIVWESIIKPINDATYDEQIRFKDVKRNLDELFKVYGRENLIDMRQKRVFVQSLNGGKGEFITRENALCALLNLGNESNRERLMNGMEWNEDQLKDVLALLDERDWDFAQKVWDYLESFRDESFALEERMTGVKPTAIPAQPIISPFGKTYRGGYYPVKYNSRKSTRGVSPEDRMQGHGAAFAQVEHGSMKERVGGGLGAPLDLRFGVLEQHLSRTVHNLAFREAVADVGRILRQPDFKAAFTETAGTAQYKALQSWLNDVASMQNQDMGGLGKAASWARERMALYTMGFKASTMLAQLTGGLSSCVEIGPVWMLKGTAKVFGHGPQGVAKAYKEAMELSPMMQNRITSFEREVNTATRKLMDYGSTNKLLDPVVRIDGWIREHAYVPMGYCQMAVDLPTFWGAFEKAMAENGGDVKKAVTYAEHTVEATQVGGATKDLAAIQRHGEVMKLFTMYYSYFSCLYNLSARRITMAARHGDLPSIMRLAGLSMLWFVEPLISSALTGKLPDEDEDWSEAGTWAEWATGQALLNPASMVVGVRDIVRFEQNLIEGKPFGFRASPAFDLVETLGRAAAVPIQVVFDDKELTQGRVKTVAKGLGMAVGSPLFGAQTITTLFNMWGVMDGTEEFRFRDLLFARQK